MDAERDRAHAGKRDRPVASGRVPPAVARGWSALLLVAGTGLVALTGVPRALLIVAAYVLLNVAYSLRARHVPLLDVFLLSAGFVLRVLLGCALVAAPPSNWLLLCSWSLALFLALAKRRGDIVGGVDDAHRPSLAGYSEGFLDQAIGITTAMTLIAYALYCMDADALRPGREFATLPFVVFGVLEYLRRVRVRGEGASPEDLLLSSPALLLCATGWVAAVLWSVALP